MSAVDPRAFDRVAVEAETLDNGLRVALLPRNGAESVVSALCYRVGGRDEAPNECGLAHFLEHMMFKGSAAWAPGAIDRLTQRLGGTNNAFTSHDATVYHFQFERGSWLEALRIESDRMRGLSLLPAEVELERDVILEEIRMVEDDLWEALEQTVAGRVFGEHPYGRSVLGARESLSALGVGALRSFHRRHYRPDRAVLVCAGGLPQDAMELVEAEFGRESTSASHGRTRADVGSPVFDPVPGRRFELRRGETARLLVAHPAPAPDDPAHVHLRLALAVLCNGRASRVQRDLVEEDPLALWASATVTGHRLGGMAVLSAEAAPGVHPERLEEELCARVQRLADRPPNAEELERAKRILFADWVFLHESLAERAMTAALEQALFRPGSSRDSFRELAAATASDVAGACATWLSAETRVVGWSLPAARPASSGRRVRGD